MKTFLILMLLVSPALLQAQYSAADLQKSAGALMETKATEANVPPAVINGVKQLAASFGFNQLDLAKLAKEGLTALNGGEDIAGPLGYAVMAVKSGNYAGVVTQLQALASGLKPTSDQKVLLTSLTDQYKSWAKAAEDAKTES